MGLHQYLQIVLLFHSRHPWQYLSVVFYFYCVDVPIAVRATGAGSAPPLIHTLRKLVQCTVVHNIRQVFTVHLLWWVFTQLLTAEIPNSHLITIKPSFRLPRPKFALDSSSAKIQCHLQYMKELLTLLLCGDAQS